MKTKKTVAMLLCFVLVKELSFTETRAAELTAKAIDKNEKTVRRWRARTSLEMGVHSQHPVLKPSCTNVITSSRNPRSLIQCGANAYYCRECYNQVHCAVNMFHVGEIWQVRKESTGHMSYYII